MACSIMPNSPGKEHSLQVPTEYTIPDLKNINIKHAKVQYLNLHNKLSFKHKIIEPMKGTIN